MHSSKAETDNEWIEFLDSLKSINKGNIKSYITLLMNYPSSIIKYIFLNHLKKPFRLLFVISLFLFPVAHAQPITGVWKGKIRSEKLELKLVKSGDSLVGTSYYYDSRNHYRRYAIKGYLDGNSQDLVWWDDQLIEQNGQPGSALLAMADFNCPNEDKMLLDGNATKRDDKNISKGPVHLQKSGSPIFADEWDYVIEQFSQGANDPNIIDSVSRIALEIPGDAGSVSRESKPGPTPEAVIPNRKMESVIPPAQPEMNTVVKKPQSIEDQFNSRKKILTTVIPLSGDSIELNFYDNAEIDGDSISLFLNNRLILQHLLLSDKAHTLKLAVKDLQMDNELVMVAENLGSIPPNTSLMVAYVNGKRYEASLRSTENSSALIRFVRGSP